MSLLIRDGKLDTDDYATLADDATLPEGRLLLSWDRLQQEAANLSGRDVGVRLPNTLDVIDAWPQLEKLPLIALDFPSFPDGRAYSQARLLRDRLHYPGELRAVGAAVVKDQLLGLHRCGFNAFELRADQDPEQCLAALEDFSLAYQPAADQELPVLQQRRIKRA